MPVNPTQSSAILYTGVFLNTINYTENLQENLGERLQTDRPQNS